MFVGFGEHYLHAFLFKDNITQTETIADALCLFYSS
jgi:hypothetical protein